MRHRDTRDMREERENASVGEWNSIRTAGKNWLQGERSDESPASGKSYKAGFRDIFNDASPDKAQLRV